MPRLNPKLAILAHVLPVGFVLLLAEAGLCLPPKEDKPEEVLRGEIITGARSPIDGQPLTASEYAQIQAEIRTAPPTRPQLAPKLQETVSLLRLRKFLKTIFPLIPIK